MIDGFFLKNQTWPHTDPTLKWQKAECLKGQFIIINGEFNNRAHQKLGTTHSPQRVFFIPQWVYSIFIFTQFYWRGKWNHRYWNCEIPICDLLPLRSTSWCSCDPFYWHFYSVIKSDLKWHDWRQLKHFKGVLGTVRLNWGWDWVSRHDKNLLMNHENNNLPAPVVSPLRHEWR